MGHQACYAASCGVFDPRGIRRMQEKRIPALGSLLAGIKMTCFFKEMCFFYIKSKVCKIHENDIK